MNKIQVKQIIKRTRTSFILVIVAAVLSQVFNIAQYAYTRSNVKRQTSEKAYRDLREIQRIVNLKTNVETAVQNAMGDVLINLQEPDKFYGIASRLVARNEHIVGCAIAMKPGYYPEKDSLFAHLHTQSQRTESISLAPNSSLMITQNKIGIFSLSRQILPYGVNHIPIQEDLVC